MKIIFSEREDRHILKQLSRLGSDTDHFQVYLTYKENVKKHRESEQI